MKEPAVEKFTTICPCNKHVQTRDKMLVAGVRIGVTHSVPVRPKQHQCILWLDFKVLYKSPALSSVNATVHTHTHLFNGPMFGTTRVSQYHKWKTNLDFTEARDSE